MRSMEMEELVADGKLVNWSEFEFLNRKIPFRFWECIKVSSLGFRSSVSDLCSIEVGYSNYSLANPND